MAETTQAHSQQRVLRTLWHRLLGKEFELLYTPRDLEVVTEPQVSSTPPLIDILILRRRTQEWTPEQLRFLSSGIRESRASHTIIEFKVRETFGEKVVRQAVGYDYFYQEGQQLNDEDVATFILNTQTPQEGTLAASGYHATDQPGVYRHDGIVTSRVTLLVINELEPVLHNAFVQCFASNRRVRTEAFRQIRQLPKEELSEELWQFVNGLHRRLQQKEGAVNPSNNDQVFADEGLTAEMLIESGRELEEFFLSHIAPEKLLAHIPEEKLLHLWEDNEQLRKQLIAQTPPEERLVGMAPEERLAGMAPEERLVGMAPEEMAALMAQIERYLRQHPAKPTPNA